METKGFKLSRIKKIYMRCKFNNIKESNCSILNLDGENFLISKSFKQDMQFHPD